MELNVKYNNIVTIVQRASYSLIPPSIVVIVVTLRSIIEESVHTMFQTISSNEFALSRCFVFTTALLFSGRQTDGFSISSSTSLKRSWRKESKFQSSQTQLFDSEQSTLWTVDTWGKQSTMTREMEFDHSSSLLSSFTTRSASAMMLDSPPSPPTVAATIMDMDFENVALHPAVVATPHEVQEEFQPTNVDLDAAETAFTRRMTASKNRHTVSTPTSAAPASSDDQPPVGIESEFPNNNKRKVKADVRETGTDSMKNYISKTMCSHELLNKNEEIILAREIQILVKWEAQREKLEEQLLRLVFDIIR
jgi:hypothetical protein